jgi:hypothetical protein
MNFGTSLSFARSRDRRASTLRLSGEGLEIGRHTVAWTDVDGFARVQRFIRVRYVAGREPSRGAALTENLGKIGLYFPPTYLSATYGTDGHGRDLYEILHLSRRVDHADIAADTPRS